MASGGQNKVGAVMVVGAGIAGVQASLDLANSGFYVYLVEQSPAIGGRMAQLDKTFPTNDCAMCIVSPKLVECGRHLNIEVITNAEVRSIDGTPGAFRVSVQQDPRYVSDDACTACGDCIKACPVEVPNEFDQGLGVRNAIYKKYAQAYPNAYCITKLDKAPCRTACPAGLNVQGYVQMAKLGRLDDCLSIIMQDLPLPGAIGRVCPHPCEEACRRLEVDEAIAIRDIKRLAADEAGVKNVPQPDVALRKEKVAIVGAGPAGLACAYHLARAGVGSTIFEAGKVPGGALAQSIPAFRLPNEILFDEISVIQNMGVEIKLNAPVGNLDELKDYDAIFLGLGAPKSTSLGLEGEDSQGVVPALEYLRRVKLGEDPPAGKKVVVIGGGDTAMDCCRTALRNGADEVVCLYRRSRVEMPASHEEVSEAEEENVRFELLAAPTKVITKGGKVTAIEYVRMELGEPDQSGRRRPVPVAGSEQVMEADLVVPAIGQATEVGFLSGSGVAVSKRGYIEVDDVTLATSRQGVFAGGDVVSGPWIAIGAIAHGREAAISMLRMFDGQDMAQDRTPVGMKPEPKLGWSDIPEDEPIKPRQRMKYRDAGERVGDWDQFAMGLSPEQGRTEGERCLNCAVCCDCLQCVAACEAKAPAHDQQPQELEISVGSVILAPGFDAYDPKGFDVYNYANHPNVVTSMEFERILSASGPYQGHLQRPGDSREPRKIAWLQCVGSRDINHCDNGYCSAVCCMYAIKEAVIAKEHSHEDLDTAIFFMDMRTPGKDFDKYFERARDEHGVRFIRSRVHTVDPAPDGRLGIEYVDDNGEPVNEYFDMVVLSVGLQTSPSAIELAQRLGVDLTPYRFSDTSSFLPVGTSQPGIYACGCFSGPKDIPQAVMEASAAARSSVKGMAAVRGTMTRELEYPVEHDVSGAAPRVGVFVCNCGINIGGVVDVPAVREYAAKLPHVVYVEENLFTCSQDTQNNMKQVIEEHGINRVVVASCSPRTHEPLFQETIREAGLNKYLFEMANIRDQDSWVHQSEPDKATDKAKDLVRMAVAKAALIEPLHQVDLPLNKTALVVGGGVAGMTAALSLAEAGYPVHLVEKTSSLGGNANLLLSTWKGEMIKPYLEDLVAKLSNSPDITLHLESEVVAAKGFVGNFTATIRDSKQQLTPIDFGVAILATGGRESRPTEYLYGDSPNVITSLELDASLKGDPELPKKLGAVAFIQCVGSREPQRPYCSRLCCTHSVESAIRIKEANPEALVYVFYREIRTYGVREDLYRKARELGVLFIRYSLDNKPMARQEGDKIIVSAEDHILRRPVEVEVDRLVLASAIVPNDVGQLAEAFKAPLQGEGFFLEAHMKLRPVDLASEGLYIAGLAHYPKPIDEAIAQAEAAVGRAMTVLARNVIRVGGVVATVDESKCSVCLTCVRTCPYNVPKIKDGKAYIEVASCYGCGACAAECPGKAITLQHFTDAQILAKEKAAMG